MTEKEHLPQPNIAVISIGGGHHPTRFERLILECDHLQVGHIIPSYFLKYDDEDAAKSGATPVEGGWKKTILEAISSTRIAYPDSQIWAFLDWKSLRGWQKPPLIALLEENGIMWGKRASDFPVISEVDA